jgi:hypothetical protein
MSSHESWEIPAWFLYSRPRLLEQQGWREPEDPWGQWSPNQGVCTAGIEQDNPLECGKKILNLPAIFILLSKNKENFVNSQDKDSSKSIQFDDLHILDVSLLKLILDTYSNQENKYRIHHFGLEVSKASQSWCWKE